MLDILIKHLQLTARFYEPYYVEVELKENNLKVSI